MKCLPVRGDSKPPNSTPDRIKVKIIYDTRAYSRINTAYYVVNTLLVAAF